MANLPISGLTASASSLASTDLAPIVQTPGVGPVKMTGLQLAGGLLGSATFNAATVTTSQPVLNLSQTWNAGAVTFTGLKFNATDTASASGSLLLDLQVGGTSVFQVSKGVNNVKFAKTTDVLPSFSGTNNSTTLVMGGGGSYLVSQEGGNMGVVTPGGTFAVIASDKTFLAGIGSSGLSFGPGGGGTAADTWVRRGTTAGTIVFGNADVASGAVAQTLQVQSNTGAGTTGPNFTIKGSAGTTAGGSIIFQTAATTSFATALTLASSGVVTVGTSATNGTFNVIGTPSPSITIGNGTTANYMIFYGVDTTGPTIRLASSGALAWSSSATNAGVAPDLFLFRDTNDTLALRRTTTAGPTTYAQQFNVYKNYTDASNYARLSIGNSVDTNTHYLYVEQAGTGGAKDLLVGTSGASNILFYSGANPRWYISSAGHLLAGAVGAGDNTYDIGASGANRPRNLYVANNIVTNSIVTTGNFTLNGGASSLVQITTGSAIYLDTNSLAVRGATLLMQLGGTSSSFPALKRSSATLQVRLADDSANAALESASVKTDAPAGGTSGTWKLGVAATVSPTSPNRTIEVDIGGTIYYIAAKTTND